MTRFFRLNFWEKSGLQVDVGNFRLNMLIPAEAGTPLIKEFVLRTFGTANWTQFCPGSDAPENRGSMVGETELSFFVAWNGREGWFFDIYIQGSKKVQL
jgi:hypothetical protein